MPDNKPNKEKPPISTVAKIIGKALIPGAGPLYAARDIASRISLNRMAENLAPYDYSTPGTTAVQRFIDAVFRNKKEEDRAMLEKELQFDNDTWGNPKERIDLLQMLAGKQQKYNTIKESKYKPKKPEEGTQYYSSSGIENEIVKELGLSGKDIKSAKDILDIIQPIASIDPKTNKPMIGKGGVVTTVPGLGQATYSAKRDSKGRVYLEYKDIWDLNPSSGLYADEKKAGGLTAEGLKNMGIEFVKDAATNIVNATATPPKVYGRIYFDPKTGKPIRQK